MDPLTCMVAALFFEARDQPITGQEAVAQVIMNRVADDRYPNTVCGVVYEPRQFSFTHDGMSDNPADYPTHFDAIAYMQLTQLASQAISGQIDYGITSTHYHADTVSPSWVNHYKMDGQIGDHVFYTNDTPYR